MSLRGESNLEVLARDLASGSISRRVALRRLAGVSLAAVLPSALTARSAEAACPEDRRCGGDCCSAKERCRSGKCKCKKGLKKCHDKCVNLKTSERHCGACGNRCTAGETCVEGECTAPAPAAVCGNGVIETGEVCDGGDLGGKTCVSVGFAGGTLACAADCKSFNTSGCTGTCTPNCTGKTCGDDGCGGSCGSCGAGQTCVGGQCQCVPNCAGKACGDDGCGGSCGSCAAGETCVSGVCQATATCGNSQIEGDEVCDGPDLGGEDCVSQGFAGGTLACASDCLSFNTSGCTGPCVPNCAGKNCGDNGCGGSCGICGLPQTCGGGGTSGQCGCTPNCAGRTCGPDGCNGFCGTCTSGRICQFDGTCSCIPGETRSCFTGPGTPGVGICQAGTQTCTVNGTFGTCQGQITAQVEICNGIDDDCDGIVDDGFDVGQPCECAAGVFGTKQCTANGTTTQCVCP